MAGKQEEPVETLDPPEPKSDNGTANPKRDASSDVVVLYDYENLRWALEKENAELEFTDLIKQARRYGIVVANVAFLPPHTPTDIQGRLRRSGFRIESCPPRKLKGLDTCDQAIEEFVKFCLHHTNIGTFVLVSGDGDFIDAAIEIENYGKKCVLFHYNYAHTSKLLLSKMAGAINLANFASTPQYVASPNSASKRGNDYSYFKMLEGLRDGTAAYEENNVCWLFMKAIISCLKDTGMASEDAYPRKSFSDLKKAVWRKISEKFGQVLTEDDDCYRAFTALRDFSILRSKAKEQYKDPYTYYILDPDHPLVAAILES